MRKALAGLGLAALVGIGAAGMPAPVLAGCDPEDRIDNSTAEQAKKKFEAAGFRNVRDLHKGCDNYWHAIGIKDGYETHLSLSPQGVIVREGD